MGDWRQKELIDGAADAPSVGLPTSKLHGIDKPGGTTLGHCEDFEWKHWAKVDLEPEEKVLASFWICEGRWRLEATSKFSSGNTVGAIAWLKLRAELDGATLETQGLPGCLLNANLTQPAFVTLSAQGSAMGPCSISEIVFAAKRTT